MKLVLIRGLPGSGKSTMARAMTGFIHCEADKFFECETGEYRYDPEKLKDSHEWCQREVLNALENRKSVVVSNTFVKLWEMEPYLKMAKKLGIESQVVEATGNWPNVHGIHKEIVDRMRRTWEMRPNQLPQ